MKYCVLLFSLIAFCSCEGNRFARGFVRDKITDEPLDSVFVAVLSGRDETYTDSIGYYWVSNDFGGCVPDCKDIDIEYSKQGYRTSRKINPADSAVIYLEPLD